MKVITDKRNVLLKRREMKMIVEASGNPGFTNALKIVVEETKSPQENIAVHNVKGKFGRDTFLIDAFIYDSKEDKEKTEPKLKVKKVEGAVVPAAVAAQPATGAKK